ncbi:MAG: inorganic phosphate transporter, partial [Acidobacteria bacterium]|nr:inorganic phosphate transporter [Acidobacteriota bacterium]
VWTGIGGLAGAFLAGALIETFGKGLLADGTVPTLTAAVATIIGAGVWVAIATRTGLPVSTTHAIVGSIAGVGVIAYGFRAFNWMALGSTVVLPLLLSPILALLVTAAVLKLWRSGTIPAGRAAADCLCMEPEPVPTLVVGERAAHFSLSVVTLPQLRVASESECAVEQPRAIRLTANHLHWLTSGGTSFARGMNDAPKMVALILGAGAVLGADVAMQPVAFGLVAVGMVAGSWMGGRRVTGVLAERVTRMDHHEGFVANLVTAAMVGPGAALGLPMSTTHVSSCAIIGLGAQDAGRLHWITVGEMMLAWVITLPAAAALGIAAFGILRFVSSI